MATLSDVARAAGLSPTAVSRYLNNQLDLPPETAARIDAAVARLRYRPNRIARRLSTGRAEAIGLAVPEIDNPFFAAFAAAAEAEAERQGYAVFLMSTRGSAEREARALAQIAERYVDGIVMLTNRPDDGTLAGLLAGETNVVLVDEDVPGAPVPKVFVENAGGAGAATRHLIDKGHRAIAYVGGPEGLMSVGERRQGFVDAMAAAGLGVRPDLIFTGDYSRTFGHAAGLALAAMANRPTALVAGSDYIVLGLYEAMRDRGLSIPADLSVIGFDDAPFAGFIDPPLTTIRQPVAEMGRTAVAMLLARIAGDTATPVARLPVQLIERGSVAALRQD
ncbi:MAG: cytochrome-c peroxidase [Tistrella sp.]|nr:cytochrome-c peroxidase [Tistrella sp.]